MAINAYQKKQLFIKGVVAACDIVAGHGQGVVLREIMDACGRREVYAEIMKNSLPETKRLATFEIENGPKEEE